MEAGECVMKKVPIKSGQLLLLMMALSTFLRFYQFPSLPAGLEWDEVSAAYESYALLLHGTDRWGNPFPAYFPAWGSGQNVLLSYLNIPFIAVFGLTAFGERFSSALLGLLTIVVFYAFVKRWYGTRTALIAAFLLGTNPWHIMASRWSLESNLLPSFLLFGIACLSYCYTSKYTYLLMPFSLFLLAIAFYAYGVAIIIIPTFLVLYFGMIGLGTLRRSKSHTKEKTWHNLFGIILSLLIFFLIASPFFVFILDNYILHTTPSFVQHLPLTIPLLIASRLAQVSSGENALAANTQFLLSGFDDGSVWNMADGYAPFGLVALPLVAIGIYYSIRRRQVHANLFLIWLVASIPMFFLFPLNTYRANALYLPLIALSAIGVNGLYDSIDKKEMRMVIVSMILVAFTLYHSLFCFSYFTTYNNDIQNAFSDGFDAALLQARSSASANEPMYVSDRIIFNYVYTLFYLKADTLDFQKHSHVIASDGVYHVRNYRNYYFSPNDPGLRSAPTFVAILKGNELPYCDDRVVLYSEEDWTVMRCFNR
jgi:4-amino-4-deoxy-L-arabinose transferase-like glycosyltransferase